MNIRKIIPFVSERKFNSVNTLQTNANEIPDGIDGVPNDVTVGDTMLITNEGDTVEMTITAILASDPLLRPASVRLVGRVQEQQVAYYVFNRKLASWEPEHMGADGEPLVLATNCTVQF